MLFGLAGDINPQAEDAFAPDVDERRAERDDSLLRDERHPETVARQRRSPAAATGSPGIPRRDIPNPLKSETSAIPNISSRVSLSTAAPTFAPRATRGSERLSAAPSPRPLKKSITFTHPTRSSSLEQ